MSEDMRMPLDMVMRIANVVEAAQRNSRVARLIDDVRFDGQARRVCYGDGGSVFGVGTDVRELFLEVLLDGGALALWPIRELQAEVRTGHAVMDAGHA